MVPRSPVSLAAVGVILALTLAGGLWLWRDRETRLDDAKARLDAHVRLLSQRIDGTIRAVDGLLLGLTLALPGGEMPSSGRTEFRMDEELRRDFARLPGMARLAVIDREGRVRRITPEPHAPKSISVLNRMYFRVHLDADRGLYVGAPMISRLNGEWILGLSRRLTAPDGAFAGVVMGVVRVAELEALLVEGAHAAALIGADGMVRARTPSARARPADAVLRGLAARPDGTGVTGATAPGGAEWLVGRARLAGYGLTLVAAERVADALAGWRRVALAGGVAWAGLVLLVLLCARAVERARAETAAATRRLILLAATDPLTGLANRRHFFERAEAEWRRAERGGAPVSAVVFDIDHFKACNDRHGHAAGDRALETVAATVRARLRAADLLGRVGGEEFALILPEAALDEALVAVERLRGLVAGCRVVAATGTFGVTASFGVAERRPAETVAQTLRRADRALYRAKAAGRDRVVADPRRPAATDAGTAPEALALEPPAPGPASAPETAFPSATGT